MAIAGREEGELAGQDDSLFCVAPSTAAGLRISLASTFVYSRSQLTGLDVVRSGAVPRSHIRCPASFRLGGRENALKHGLDRQTVKELLLVMGRSAVCTLSSSSYSAKVHSVRAALP